MAGPGPVEIRRIVELEELQEVEALQREVWNFEPIDIVPSRLMRISSRSGALVLGARDAGGALIAFAYGFPGIRDGRLVYCSHMLAVKPEIRDRGLGRRLKLAQREWLLEQPLDLVTWTFDPLEVKNGFLNLTRLGATSGEYIENLYGRTSSPLHGGLDTDRFFLHWEIRSERVVRRVSEAFDAASYCREMLERIPLSRKVNATERNDEGTLLCTGIDCDRPEDELLLEVPWEASPLRTRFVEEGRTWQREMRRACHAYFSRGYRLVAVLKKEEATSHRCFYLLQRDPMQPGSRA